MKSKYSILVKILDGICQSAPDDLSIYKPVPSSPNYGEKLIAARSRALLHLFLMVECGCDEDDFKSREELICDGGNDGGLDTYFIDDDKKRVLLVQSKFRASAYNFEEVSVKADELVKTDFDRITQGHSTDSKGKKFNEQVLKFQRRLSKINGIANYKITVILLANLNQYSASQVRRLVGQHSHETFDANKVYERLVFPVCQGTYFNPNEISIRIPLSKNESPRLKQTIKTSAGQCDITVIYVPAVEIGKILLKYKNAILSHNPRNYLALKQSSKSVNAQIASSITNLSTNDFAILNNGITVLADNCSVTDHSGKKNVGILTMVNPQIINGGQTAYTLSQLYSESFDSRIFKGKEVLLKIVTLQTKGDKRDEFIGMISNATNQQNPVQEADRRSNNPALTELQQRIFSEYGFFFERKRGEFFNGGQKGYMAGQHVINRAELMRAWYGFTGNPSMARRSETAMFDENELKKVLPDAKKFRQVFLSYIILSELKKAQKSYKRGESGHNSCDNAFTYGKYAAIAAVACIAPEIRPNMSIDDIERIAANLVDKVLGKWHEFEQFVKSKQSDNAKYFGDVDNFDNYYKGMTINADIREFFTPTVQPSV